MDRGLAMRKVLSVLCLMTAVLGGGVSASRAEPATIRISWVVVPGELTPIMFAPPGLARHEGVSYVVEHTHFAGGPLSVAAFAAGEVDMAGFGYSTIASAIQGAGVDDLRVIADVDQDGVDGWYSNQFMVRNDSPIHTIEDLKGHATAINSKGGLSDIPLRIMLRKHGLDDEKDVTILEAAPPNAKAMLLEGKVDLVGTLLPFAMDPELGAKARTLFTAADAAGRQQVSTLVARAGFIAKNRAALVDFLEDYIRAVRWFTDPANHHEAVAIVAGFTKRPPELFDSWLFTKGDQYHNPAAIPDPSILQANIDAMRSLGFVKGEIDMTRHTDGSLAREAAARG
jgi:sulfonate transport system substrate-binding protein